MNTLRERMHDTVEGHHTDLTTLVERSRRQGSRLRWRRRLATAGTSLAVIAVVGVGASTLLPGDGATRVVNGDDGQQDSNAGDEPVPVSPSEEPVLPAPGPETRQADGQLTAIALYAAVTRIQPGTASDVAGQGPVGGGPDTYAEFAFAPSVGDGAGLVGLNLQHSSILRDPNSGLSVHDAFVCDPGFMESCQVVTLLDGSLVRTYAERTITPNGTGERLVAERLAGKLRVVASASNGFEGSGNTWDITRPAPVLTTDQLIEVVGQPWWAFELPTDFPERAGLGAYEELPGGLD